jgi:hypothetical protein
MFDSDPEAMRFVNAGNQNFDAIAKNLNQDILGKIRDGMTPGKGQGGPGSGGGEGKGKGTGTGSSTGSDSGKLTEREKRMLRWVMVFETQNPNDYVKQLAGLNAILAIPTGAGQYKLIKDLMHPQLVSEDVASLNRIYWVDDKPQSVASVLQILHVNMRPSHFVAFMPQELEQRLGEMERQYQGTPEDEIYETKFKVFRTPNGYDVKVVNQTRK